VTKLAPSFISLKDRLAAHIAQTGPLTVAQYMHAALYDPQHGYYTTRADIGVDFITAPESSQMFGELIGLWCAHEWRAMGAPDPFLLIEFGPGRGALIADALRAARVAPDFLAALRLHLVEISPALRARQKQALDALGVEAAWHEGWPPAGAPSLMIMNEFLDCLPVRQWVRAQEGWREKVVGTTEKGDLCFGLTPPLPLGEGGRGRGGQREVGAVREEAPSLPAFVAQLVECLQAAPGRALIIDYAGDGWGDTLQAVRAHEKVDPLAAPGECDLTAHVDFAALRRGAEGLRVDGPVPQRDFLRALGIDARAEALARAHPDRAERIGRERTRLTEDMGVLFKALCLSNPSLPPPAGF
jgi:NADH dehydrogenase [ubiquinone] 1 alpha subcomplex assembly factor 7